MARHPHPRVCLASLFALLAPVAAQALDGIVLEVRELTVAGIPVKDARVRFELLGDSKTRLTVSAAEATLPQPAGKLTGLTLTCTEPVVAEPRYACDAGRFVARGGVTGALDMKVALLYRTDTSVVSFSGAGQKVAGTTADFAGELDDRGWQVKASTGAASVAALRAFAKPWFELPADITGDGQATLAGTFADRGQGLDMDATVRFAELSLTNEASTVVSDAVGADLRVVAQQRGGNLNLDVKFTSGRGQALVDPVLFDFGANPTELELRGTLRGNDLHVESLKLAQKDLLDLTGQGRVNLAGEMPSVSGDFRIARLQFPAGYTSYMQITLATSILGDATMGGSLSGELSLVDNGVTRLHVVPADIDLVSHQGRLHMSKIHGDVYWSPAGAVEARLSKLGWQTGGAYGLSGGAADIEFVAYGLNFALSRPTKLPVFDGAIAIETLAMGNIGAPDMEVSFRGAVEPISMPLLAKAFGWPEFAGKLAATIPGVRLANDVLTFDGNVESEVFGGRITGSNIRLQDPLGNLPQFFADVRARDLDLHLLTQTFEVGSITGKLEADVLGLELFAWSPIAFDARLETPKGDKSRHRISAKAVSSLSNVGGGGGGVMQALQSGVLKFFDEYSYEKLGIRCRLVNDVCEMSGIEPAGVGYYIVKGSGLPRIDIVGNAGRVRWSQLLSSITTTEYGEASAQ